MSKATTPKSAPVDLSHFSKSTFTLTFAIEILGIEVWDDCSEGWLDLGPCQQGMKIQYQLYPGQVFDVDILIWPHVAKIWCGAGNSGWVRTWQFLERRFLTFTIRHMFPVRVVDLQNFTATITPTVGTASFGSNAKSDKCDRIFIPRLKFGDLRYFAPLEEREQYLTEYVLELIWNLVETYIPSSPLDGLFDVPGPVTDVRHQDTIMYYVKEAILNKVEEEIEPEPEPEEPKVKDRRESKMVKEKEKNVKKPEVPKIKFEIKLQGDSILSGVGRIVPFVKIGENPNDLGEFIAIISSTNLPAEDDQPIIFVNVDTLFDAPIEHLKNLRIFQVYTRWTIGNEVHDSELQKLKPNKIEINFYDHHAIPMDPFLLQLNTATFLDIPFEIQLRGVKLPEIPKEKPRFFGYKKGDQNFGTASCKFVPEDKDVLIAVTKIDARCMTKGINKFIRRDYPLFPPTVSVVELDRAGLCSNDVNNIRASTCPKLIVPSYVVLEAQMTLEVSMGCVGCQPKKLAESLSRLFCLIHDTESVMALLKEITEVNNSIVQTDKKDDILTGFALDVGDMVLLYIEGPADGPILRIWGMTEDFHPKVKAVFSSSNRYATRIYPALLMTVPFNVLKMYVPLGVILACPPIYAIPALPVLTRTALLKLGRLIGDKLRVTPTRNDFPSVSELKSFKLELCAAPKPVVSSQVVEASVNNEVAHPNALQKINWDEHKKKSNDHIPK